MFIYEALTRLRFPLHEINTLNQEQKPIVFLLFVIFHAVHSVHGATDPYAAVCSTLMLGYLVSVYSFN